ncbi:amidohydrolase family protein [Actinacidiphila guanduensis]|uniref:Cytosine/adenosine deaminase n=1 Tax=Actinacidiphila guanduensis TaxID=310781 RepID=A0A1G9W6B9_9ACTN|nr:amidohydrolase family protein [Actinacidiphila guanduensis]SDM79741.1 Cytosine/adenosine deaminase [Actinacidiphila guanduensis]
MNQQDLLISGGHVVTLDPALGDIEAGDVLVRDGRIAAVGPTGTVLPADAEPHGVRRIDARGRLVIPGMVDAHRHVWQGALGAATPDTSLMGYVTRVVQDVAPGFDPDDIYAGTLWGALQALHAGVTTVADWAHNLRGPGHTDANVRGLRDSGIRGVFLHGGPGTDTAGFFGRPGGRHPDDAARVRDEHFADGDGRLRMGMALRGPAFTDEAATRADVAYARELGLPISVHVGMSGFPGTVAALDRLGLLGPDINHAHANQLTEHEWQLIADSGGSVAVSPTVELLMALGTHPANGPAAGYGIRTGLGVDTTTSAGTDLFSEMRLALAAERSRTAAPAIARDEAVGTVTPDPRDVLRLATAGGAEAWHMAEEIGTLTPGKQADLVLVDLRAPHLDAFGDPVAALVLGAGPSDVETVLVGGDVVKEAGRLVGAHAEAARELVTASRRRIRARVAAVAGAGS